MHAGRHNPNYAYFLNSDYITLNNLVRDLGIIYDSNLCFRNFVNSAVSRAYKRINSIFRAFCSRNLVRMTRIYTTYVRPILEYCSLHMVTFHPIRDWCHWKGTELLYQKTPPEYSPI